MDQKIEKPREPVAGFEQTCSRAKEDQDERQRTAPAAIRPSPRDREAARAH